MEDAHADDGAARVTNAPASTVTIRRSPKYGIFLALGVAVGIIAAIVLTMVFDGTSEPSRYTEVTYSLTQTFGFILLWCIPAGIALMMILAMILDRASSRHLREATVQVDLVDER